MVMFSSLLNSIITLILTYLIIYLERISHSLMSRSPFDDDFVVSDLFPCITVVASYFWLNKRALKQQTHGCLTLTLNRIPRLYGVERVWSDANTSFPSQKICCLRVFDYTLLCLRVVDDCSKWDICIACINFSGLVSARCSCNFLFFFSSLLQCRQVWSVIGKTSYWFSRHINFMIYSYLQIDKTRIHFFWLTTFV